MANDNVTQTPDEAIHKLIVQGFVSMVTNEDCYNSLPGIYGMEPPVLLNTNAPLSALTELLAARSQRLRTTLQMLDTIPRGENFETREIVMLLGPMAQEVSVIAESVRDKVANISELSREFV